jgi:hypothetical protein
LKRRKSHSFFNIKFYEKFKKFYIKILHKKKLIKIFNFFNFLNLFIFLLNLEEMKEWEINVSFDGKTDEGNCVVVAGEGDGERVREGECGDIEDHGMGEEGGNSEGGGKGETHLIEYHDNTLIEKEVVMGLGETEEKMEVTYRRHFVLVMFLLMFIVCFAGFNFTYFLSHIFTFSPPHLLLIPSDRTNIGVIIEGITDDDYKSGLILSSFYVGYVYTQIPGVSPHHFFHLIKS